MAKIAVLLAHEFEDSELTIPVVHLREAGHEIELLGTHGGQRLAGLKGTISVITDASFTERRPDMYDALLIPGGRSPAQLRRDANAVQFVREFAATERPIAAVCHGPQLLIEAGLVAGVRMTAWPSVQTELRDAGDMSVDHPVVQDRQFITSRKPADLDAFSAALLEQLHDAERLESVPPAHLVETPRPA